MGTKMKGFLKGIKSFSSQIFDDEKEKEEEIQIGGPTDVKHLSHIGCDGPGVESPTWMKGFDGSQSGPLDKTGPMVETPEVNWVSEDSNNRKARKNGSSHRSTRSVETARDAPLLPRSSRNRRRSMDNNTLQSADSTNKTRHTRRHQSEGRRHSQDQKGGDDMTKADAPKKSSRRKPKSKEETGSPTTKSTADESDLGSDTV